MLDLRTGKEMTRGGFLKGILASGIAPAITLGTLAKVESANASVCRGMMRNVGARIGMMGGGNNPILITTSMYSNGNTGSYCYYQFNDTANLNITFTLWANTLSSVGSDSDCLFKYGIDSNGVAFATSSPQGNALYPKRSTVLCEAKYWIAYDVATYSNWNHWAITVNSTSNPFTIYKNGILLEKYYKSSGTGTVIIPTGFFYLFGYSNSKPSLRKFNGYTTRFTMWNKILSASEIAADYALGATPPTLTSDVAHYWDGTLSNGKFKDLAGSCDLTIGSGCSQSNITPWS